MYDSQPACHNVCLHPLNTSSEHQKANNGNETQSNEHFRLSSYAACRHFVPDDCEKYGHPTSETSHSNASKVVQILCYSDVVDGLIAPAVREDNGTIFIDVHPFWKDRYWRPFEIANFTLHYEYNIENPESCGGEASRNNDTYECKWEKLIEVPLHDAKVDAVKIRRETIASEEE
uniref:Uncharacterized protein n=1 Tax=Plectus sambesii TaxID=2011161 RepID=A0A914UXN2_9BILA